MHEGREGGGVAHDSVLFVLPVGCDAETGIGSDGAHAHVRNARRHARHPSPGTVGVERVVGVGVRTSVAQDRLRTAAEAAKKIGR